jgi:hypothetical protein
MGAVGNSSVGKRRVSSDGLGTGEEALFSEFSDMA